MKLSQLALSGYGFAGRLMLGIISFLAQGSPRVIVTGILHSPVRVMH